MSYLVEYEPEAFIDLEKLDPVVRERIITKIHWLAENFEQLTPQPLTGKFAGFYKLRVGDYRVVYDFIAEDKAIIVDSIGHRRDIYD